MKKILSVLLVVVIVFNFIGCNYVYAEDINSGNTSSSIGRQNGEGEIDPDAAKSLIENGTDSSGNSMEHTNFGTSLLAVIFQYIAAPFLIGPVAIQTLLSLFTMNPASPGELSVVNTALTLIGDIDHHFTIERTVFNEIAIFNIDVFNVGDSYKVGTGYHAETIYQHSINLDLKKSVASWFYTIRLLAMMINLCVLIYVGIRMATSSIASQEAKYKKMLIWWVESMIILFLLQYIMYAIIYVGNIILNIIYSIRANLIEAGTAVSFEDTVLNKLYRFITNSGGKKFLLYTIFFFFLTALHIKFFITYMKRMFTIFFLVVISPLITVTFPIDKLDNGKAEAFMIWFKELVINVLIQPIHAIIYLVFVYTAGKIAEQSPIVAMIFLLIIGRVENIVRKVFKITDSVENVDSARKGKPSGGGIGKAFRLFMKKDG